MKTEPRHVQLRLSAREKRQIDRVAERFEMSAADIIRGALTCGLPVFISLTEARHELMKKFVRLLKKEARVRIAPRS